MRCAKSKHLPTGTSNINSQQNRIMKKTLILLSSLPFMLGTAFAQYGQGPNNNPDTVPTDPPDTVPTDPPDTIPTPPPDTPPPPAPNVEIPDELVDLHSQVTDLRDSLRESRNAVLESLGEEASRDEIIEALAEWRDQNEDLIENMQDLSEQLRDAIREVRPGPGGGIDIPGEISEMRDNLSDKRDALAESRQSVIDALGDDATDEEIRAAIQQWREDNADAIAETAALAEEVRTWFRENRPGRGGNDNGGPPAHVLDRREQFKKNANQIRQNRRAMAEAMQDPDLSPEERRNIREQFREEQQDLIEERKQLRRQERTDQVGAGGDRRPGG